MSILIFRHSTRVLYLAALAPWLCSCGGGQIAATGRATVSVTWPESSRLIPQAANSIQVTLIHEASVVGTAILERPVGGGSAQASFENLPVGQFQIVATAHPQAGAAGTAQASAISDVAVEANQTTAIKMTLASTIVRGSISPASTTLNVGQTVTLTGAFENTQHQAVFVSTATLQWRSQTPAVATVDAAGQVTAVSEGTATIEVKDSESGVVATASITVRPSTPGAVFNPANGHYYKAVSVPTGVTWPDAKAAAEARGGYLATVTSAAENDFIFTLINDNLYWKQVASKLGPWLGGQRVSDAQGPNANWQWITGEAWGYTRWAVNQPDNAGGGENRLSYQVPGSTLAATWNDMPAVATPGNDNPIAYVIEWDSNPN
ncbi:MAG: Ig-like domain-containing protein [Armatimonas sp.]